MNNGSSLFIISGEQYEGTLTASSCHQKSLPSFIGTSFPVRWRTKTFSTSGQSLSAESTIAFVAIVFPPRFPSLPDDHKESSADVPRHRTAQESNSLGCDDDSTFTILNSVSKGLGGEPSKDGRVDRTNSGTSQESRSRIPTRPISIISVLSLSFQTLEQRIRRLTKSSASKC
jgi:hypothetical protein